MNYFIALLCSYEYVGDSHFTNFTYFSVVSRMTDMSAINSKFCYQSNVAAGNVDHVCYKIFGEKVSEKR